MLISYVLIYVAKQRGHPKHEAVCDSLKALLEGGVRAILVSERSEETPACGMMEARHVPVERLIDQSLGADERQTLLLSDAAHPLPKPRPSRDAFVHRPPPPPIRESARPEPARRARAASPLDSPHAVDAHPRAPSRTSFTIDPPASARLTARMRVGSVDRRRRPETRDGRSTTDEFGGRRARAAV